MNVDERAEQRTIRVLFADHPPYAFNTCKEFPTLQPYLRCPFPGWCSEVRVFAIYKRQMSKYTFLYF